MKEDHACPSCDGRKIGCGFVMDQSTGRMHISAQAPCPQCGGKGEVTQEQLDWIKLGKRCREERLARLEFPSDAARRLGISIEQLTAAELGRIAPHILLALPVVEAKSST